MNVEAYDRFVQPADGVVLGASKRRKSGGMSIRVGEFNPDQPRDESGKWTSEGGARIFNIPADIQKVSGWPGEPERYQWVNEPGHLVTGMPINRDELPNTLFHVTTNAPAVLNSGVLLGQQTGGGLGGGQADGVSFTTDKTSAGVIERELTRSVRIARGDDTIDSLTDYARKDEKTAGLPVGTLDHAVEAGRQMWDNNVGVRDVYSTDEAKRSLMKDAFNSYLNVRGHDKDYKRLEKDHPSLTNPILFGDQKKLRLINPDNVRILRVPKAYIPTLALITTGSDAFLHEVRVYADVPVKKIRGAEAATFVLRGAEFNPDQPRDELGQWTFGAGVTDADVANASIAWAKNRYPRAEVSERKVTGLEPRDVLYKGDVDGLRVRTNIPNTGSISATFNDQNEYDELPGIRAVPLADIDVDTFAAADDSRRVDALALAIKESGEISPLIVIVDAERKPYVLEGGHRVRALKWLGKKFAPAVVLVDHRAMRGLAAAAHPETLVHEAAAAHLAKIEVVIRYAFAMGRKALGKTTPNVDAAVKAVRRALEATLRPTLLKALIAGGEAGVAMLIKQLRTAEFNPDQPRDERGQWTDVQGTSAEFKLRWERGGLPLMSAPNSSAAVPDEVTHAQEVLGRLPTDLIREARVERIELYADQSDAADRIDEYLKSTGGDYVPEGGARGLFDRGTGLMIATTYVSEDGTESGRNIYHEFAHSLTDRITDPAWEEPWGEWVGKTVGHGQDEAFAEAFAEWFTSKREADPVNLEDFKLGHPKTAALFEGWGW